MKVYRYYCSYRPPMPGSIPRKGLIRVASYDYKQSISGRGAWGFAEYDMELTEKEIADYELWACRNNPLDYGEEK